MKGNRVACPKCREEGRDSGGDHAKPLDNGKGLWCFHGHGIIWFDNNYEREDKPISNLSLSAILEYPIKPIPSRKISLETCQRYGVRSEQDEADNSQVAVYYPYTKEDGTVCGFKKRKLPKTFSWVGKPSGLFGQSVCKENAKLLIIVEGEHDVLAGWEMLKARGKNWNIVSIPNGANEAGTVDQAVMKELEWIVKHPNVVLLLDTDKPGKATALGLAEALVSQTEVRIGTLPLKDSSDCWEAGLVDEWHSALSNAKRHVADQIVLGTDGGLDELMVPLKPGIMFDFLPRTSHMLHGIRTRELTTLIAPPKCGKSSLMRHIQYDILSKTDEQVGGIFLEETTNKTKQSILAFHAGMALNAFRADPGKADKHLIQEAYETILPRLHLFQHKNKTITDDLLERKIDFLVKALGVRTVILDHAAFVTGTRDTQNERKDIDNMLYRLSRSVEDNDYRLFVVSHINRKGREQSKTNSGEKYPYWEILGMTDARGSGAFEQCSHNMIALEKQHLDPEGDNTRGLIRTRVLLSREWGTEGVGDYLSFDHSGRFKPIDVQL